MNVERIILKRVSEELSLALVSIEKTAALLDADNSVPFIARYRKEMTGGLDEDQIRSIDESVGYYRGLESRKQTVLKSIDEQGKLTPELRAKIGECLKSQDLEDLYLPFRPKRRTRGTIAREKGLAPLAERMMLMANEAESLAELTAPFIDSTKELESADAVLSGARDIVAEIISEDAEARKTVRSYTQSQGILVSKVKSDENNEFKDYHAFRENVRTVPAHRILAINRGEKTDRLRVKIEVEADWILEKLQKRYIRNRVSVFAEQMQMAVEDGYARLIRPAIEREVRNALTEAAEAKAITVFAANLRQLLLQPPIRDKIILGIDPGYRTGCKVAVIDRTGKYLEGTTIFPTPPKNDVSGSKATLKKLVEKHDVNLVAIGNGTGSRETEQVVADLIREISGSGISLEYVIVNEAGASVYSASAVAREEFPALEASLRGNISIARRVLDPLAELVKIDPKSIGVGMYQHDVNQTVLSKTLSDVVESCVNLVGVNLNTASVSLLGYVSGLNRRTAQSIVGHRDEHGRFGDRSALKTVAGIGDHAFQQAAGFLRIPGGGNPLDNTAIHPESYHVATDLLSRYSDQEQGENGVRLTMSLPGLDELAGELGVGVPTLEDIVANLAKPGLDPRDNSPRPMFRKEILSLEDLSVGMKLSGTIRNVLDFGAFVDVGLKSDGLVHISELADRYVKNPLEVVRVGQVVEVRVISIDLKRQRVALSLKQA